MKLPEELHAIAQAFPHRLLFATVSGAHLYGFPSPDSDWDLRGCHVLPLRQVIGLRQPAETAERLAPEADIDLDLVSHDVHKFCRLLLRPNGYVLEQLLSPLIVLTSPEHQRLRELAPRLVTRHHAHHYLGFARNQWRMFEKEPRVKTLLYVYRTLLTGIHLMQTGELQATLPLLLQHLPTPGVDELIQRKTTGAEKQPLPTTETAQHAGVVRRLFNNLESAHEDTNLPSHGDAFEEIDELVCSVRLAARP